MPLMRPSNSELLVAFSLSVPLRLRPPLPLKGPMPASLESMPSVALPATLTDPLTATLAPARVKTPSSTCTLAALTAPVTVRLFAPSLATRPCPPTAMLLVTADAPFSTKSTAAPALTAILVVAGKFPAPTLPCNVPPLTVVGPLYVFEPLSSKVPGPPLLRPTEIAG